MIWFYKYPAKIHVAVGVVVLILIGVLYWTTSLADKNYQLVYSTIACMTAIGMVRSFYTSRWVRPSYTALMAEREELKSQAVDSFALVIARDTKVTTEYLERSASPPWYRTPIRPVKRAQQKLARRALEIRNTYM
jgi:hypothetical protein